MNIYFSSQMESLQSIAQKFRINIYENERSTGKGLIIAIGSGLMMATMDAISSARFAVEFGKEERNNVYFTDFIALASIWADYVCVHAWFSITRPDSLKNLLQAVPKNKLFWKSNVDLGPGTSADSFEELINVIENNFLVH